MSLPLSAYTDTKMSSVSSLLDRVARTGLPSHWIDASKRSQSAGDVCKLVELPCHSIAVLFTVTVNSTFC